ncbi:MAG: YHS domain-containing protein [Deltaproteobacteria bacterium]|nr:YHS domain-containing protein [Deltaproteobacteria bacterium]
MKKVIIVILGLLLALSLAGAGLAADPTAKEQTDCPVMVGKINKSLYADYQGQRVYFCCPGCIEAFRKDPESYLKKMKEQGITPEKSPGGK